MPPPCIPLKHPTSDQGTAKAEKQEMLSSRSRLFPPDRSSLTPVLNAAQVCDVSACGHITHQDWNKLLRYFPLRATQTGRMRSQSQWCLCFWLLVCCECVPVQPRALHPFIQMTGCSLSAAALSTTDETLNHWRAELLHMA